MYYDITYIYIASRKTPTPMVGKMPWLKKDGPGRASKFGPPVSGVTSAVPPPTQVTAPLTLGAPGGASSGPGLLPVGLPQGLPPPTIPPQTESPAAAKNSGNLYVAKTMIIVMTHIYFYTDRSIHWNLKSGVFLAKCLFTKYL